ncbi:MAG: hypothetical protein ACREJY_03745 [Candidatus Rokuibacteriota bacterium]
MIGESLSPTPRQRAEEILRRLAAEREALLVKFRILAMMRTPIFLLLVPWSGRPRPGESDRA